jgi:glutaredoxin
VSRLVLYTRAGCHLCDDAKAVLERIGEPFTEVDISTDAELTADYGDQLPVIMLDGREHGFWRVDEARLRRDLERRIPG